MDLDSAQVTALLLLIFPLHLWDALFNPGWTVQSEAATFVGCGT